MIIIGTGGHALDLLSDGFILSTYNPLYFFDSVNTIFPTMISAKYKVFKSIDELEQLPTSQRNFILALGNPLKRQMLCDALEKAGLTASTYSSPKALIAPTAIVGTGSNIMPFAGIFGNSLIGKGALINSHATIHHDSVIGDFCEISPGCRVLGRVNVGHYSVLGANATILPGINIGSNCIVGAGAVLTKDLPNKCIAVGVPAKIRSLDEE